MYEYRPCRFELFDLGMDSLAPTKETDADLYHHPLSEAFGVRGDTEPLIGRQGIEPRADFKHLFRGVEGDVFVAFFCVCHIVNRSLTQIKNTWKVFYSFLIGGAMCETNQWVVS